MSIRANQRLRAEIKAYYESHSKAMEPKLCLAENGYDMRLGLIR